MHENGVSVDELLSSRIVIVAPHMDDEVLGCGNLMLRHTNKSEIYCIYATAGNRSPAPLLPWQGRAPSDLASTRAAETANVLAKCGIPQSNATFLGLRDGKLHRQAKLLRLLLQRAIREINPAFVIVPFSLDLHRDHVAVHRALSSIQRSADAAPTMLEYFIYYRWPLLQGNDVRSKAPTRRMVAIEASSGSCSKADLIAGYESQTQIMYPWQTSPVLTSASITERCSQPEWLLVSNPVNPISDFQGSGVMLRLAHLAQTLGKRRKDQAVAITVGIRDWLRPNSDRQ